MHYRGDEVRPQRLGEQPRVLQVSGDERSPAHRGAMSATQIVVDDRLVSGRGQRLAGMAAHIAGAVGDKNSSAGSSLGQSPALRTERIASQVYERVPAFLEHAPATDVPKISALVLDKTQGSGSSNLCVFLSSKDTSTTISRISKL